MTCAWEAFIKLLPPWMHSNIDDLAKQSLQELRLRIGLKPELKMHSITKYIDRTVTRDDLNFVINNASKYSPWAAQTISNGYITAAGGHRIGICGDVVLNHDVVTGLKNPTSLCIRIARDFNFIRKLESFMNASVLIIGPPGSGKTTLLRDLIRSRSQNGQTVAVIDERGEVFPKFGNTFCFSIGEHTDVLCGCGKEEGINMALRTMSPQVIAVDEITAASDCSALLHAGWSGVDLIATAHARSKRELTERPVYRPILEKKLFQALVTLRPDKQWSAERMDE